jgi:hypothetical protein
MLFICKTNKFLHFFSSHPTKRVWERQKQPAFVFYQYSVGDTSSFVLELRENQKGANLQNTRRDSETLRMSYKCARTSKLQLIATLQEWLISTLLLVVLHLRTWQAAALHVYPLNLLDCFFFFCKAY